MNCAKVVRTEHGFDRCKKDAVLEFRGKGFCSDHFPPNVLSEEISIGGIEPLSTRIKLYATKEFKEWAAERRKFRIIAEALDKKASEIGCSIDAYELRDKYDWSVD